MAAETPQMNDPRRLHLDHVVVDDDSADAIEDAVHHLSVCRSPMNQGDGALHLHVLTSLIAQARALLPDAVADARNQDHTWADIAKQLGVSVDTARRRYAARTRRAPIDPD